MLTTVGVEAALKMAVLDATNKTNNAMRAKKMIALKGAQENVLTCLSKVGWAGHTYASRVSPQGGRDTLREIRRTCGMSSGFSEARRTVLQEIAKNA
jgi:hypothetical protein